MNLKTKLIFFFVILATVFSGHSRPLSPAPEIAGDVAPPPVQKADYSSSAFKPGIAVIVGVLTTVFSVTFLLLLYVKHCKSNISGEPDYFYYRSATGFPVDGRKNSGINPLVIESLPVFRFGSLIGGQKEGLECAVCLNRFEPAEVLRLLPKCKHAFHVECIDTWLDSHSTCPLCRFRIDPEDVLLVDRFNPVGISQEDPLLTVSTRRVSGRHSSAGERGRGGRVQTTSSRRSCDGSFGSISVAHRKDGLLMTTVDNSTSKPSSDRRVSHRIIVSRDPSGPPHIRWSDVHPCDLFYLRSEMLMNEGRQSSASKGGQGSQHTSRVQEIISIGNGRSVINERSVSEITGLSRLQPGGGGGRQRERHTGVISRWTAWISQSRPAVRPGI